MRRFSVATTCAWGGGWGGANECGASLLRPPVLGVGGGGGPMNAALLCCDHLCLGWGVGCGVWGGVNECGASISAVMCTIADGASSLGHFSFFSCNPSVHFRIMFMCSNKRDFGHIYYVCFSSIPRRSLQPRSFQLLLVY